MTLSDDRDRRLGAHILSLNLIPRDQLSVAYSQPQRTAQTDLCSILEGMNLLSPVDSQRIRNDLGISVSPPQFNPISVTQNSTPAASRGSSVGDPTQDPTLASHSKLRQQGSELYRQIHAQDPSYSPHADLVFDKLDMLGEGGMGIVHRVKDKRLDRLAALKVIQPEQVGQRAILRFEREAKITAKLDHPSIPPVYEAGTNSNGEHYLLMRVIEGATLEERISSYQKNCEPRILEELVEVLIKVCEAMAYAHSRNIVHRDLKPANIMVGQFGEVMVMDWGLAFNLRHKEHKFDDDSEILGGVQAKEPEDIGVTRDGVSLGTPGYMSPEQAGGETLDPRTDIFSLGAILMEILVGQTPIQADSNTAAIIATIENRIKKPAEVRSDFPRELGSISEMALAFKADDRYQFANDMLEDLKNYLAHRSVLVHRYSVFERARRILSRHTLPLVVVSLLFLLVAIGGGLWSELRRSRAAGELSQALLEKSRREKALLAQSNKERQSALRAAQQNLRLERKVRELAEQSKRNADRAKDAALDSAKRIKETLNLISKARAQALRGAKKEQINKTIAAALQRGGRTLALFMTAAQIYESAGFVTLAQAHLEEAVQRFPPAYDALFYLHRLETRADPVGRFRMTQPLRKLWRTANERDDENQFTVFAKAYKAHQAGDIKEAIKLYDRVEKYSTSFTWTYINRGVLRYSLGQKSEALEDFNRALKLDPGLAKIYSNRAFIRYELEDWTGAIRDATRAIELDPAMAIAYSNRALARIKLGQRGNALSDARRAIELSPNSPQTHGALGTILSNLGQKKEALGAYDQALKLAPGFVKALRRRALTRFELGDLKGSLADLQSFLKQAPGHPDSSLVKLKIAELERALESP
jgi:serine/threonine protein kinase